MPFISQKISINEENYPEVLKKIPDPPDILYFKGSYTPEIFANCVAIVGSRRMSPYGEKVVKFIISALAKNVTVVSGFMYGVDTCAHLAALENKLATIAVLPCGIDNVIPSTNTQLYTDIIQNGGLVLSEIPSTIEPKKWTFVRRNRIIAGLAKVVIVVEASEKSGSLITAGYAHDYRRKLFAVPGNIFSNVSKGTCQLIKKGAEPLCSAFDVNNYLGLTSVGFFKQTHQSSQEKTILTILTAQPMGMDELLIQTNLTSATLTEILTDMLLAGKIKNEGGLYYAC